MLKRFSSREGLIAFVTILLVAVIASLSTLYLFQNYLSQPGSAYVEKITEKQVYLEESATIDAVNKLSGSLVNIFPKEEKEKFVTGNNDFKRVCLEKSDVCQNVGLVLTSDGLVLYGGDWQDKKDVDLLAMDGAGKLYELELSGKMKGFSLFKIIKEGELGLEISKRTKFYNMDAVQLGNLRNVRVGQMVLALDSFLIGSPKVENGMVSGKLHLNSEIVDLSENLQPLEIVFNSVVQGKYSFYFNLDGQLLVARSKDGLEFTAESIYALLQRYSKNEKSIETVVFGLRCISLDRNVAKLLGIEVDYGCLVAEGMDLAGKVITGGVSKGSLAEKAGIRPGDIIMEIDNESLLNVNLMDMVMKKGKTEKSTLSVFRGGKVVELII